MKKIIFLILIVSTITATVCISASALDGEYNCPVYIYDSYTQSFFGYGYLYLEGDTTDSIFRLHGYNERDITLDFSAPNEAGTDYYLNELQLNAVNGPGLYGINFVSGPDANSMSTLPVIPMYNCSYSDGVFWSQRYDWSGSYDGFCIVLYFNGFEPSEAYDTMYDFDDIQSGFNDVISGINQVQSGIAIDSLPSGAFDSVISPGLADPGVSGIDGISIMHDIANHSVIVALFGVVLSFAFVGYLLYGKKG